MDRITKSLVVDFFESSQIKQVDDSKDFELFCNYTIISNEYNKTFDVELVTIGSGHDTGIDGIAIVVNGYLIEEIEEIDDLLQKNGYLEVTYIFIQTKTSSNFEAKEINTFYFGVNDFFSESPQLPRNDDIKHFAELSDHILAHASSFKENPKCKTFFVTTGVRNEDDENINAVLSHNKRLLENYNLFEEVQVHTIGANELGKLYRKTKNPISASFVFVNKVTLPEIEGINQAYLGLLPFSEFRKIIIDENDNIHSVFDDNVRDFQGSNNPVNKSISETLKDKNSKLFSVLNNGVAIVANSIKTSGNNFTITDYQIVNGCQTSSVLYENRNNPKLSEINVPVKLIVTDNEDVKSQITVSTNNQTAIKKEQLTAMSDFQRNLEQYYDSIEVGEKLFYERRAKQYSSDKNVVKRKIITVPIQIKSFLSIVNQNPHLVTSYFGSLIKNIGEDGSGIFERNHQYGMYYLAGLAFYKLDALFNSSELDKRYKKIKFFLIMLIPKIASKENLPPMTSQRKVEAYCTPIIEKLNDPITCKKIFETAIKIVERSGQNIDDKQILKSRAMTEKILAAYANEKV